MKKNNWVIIIILFWIVILGVIVGVNEYTLRTGQEVMLKTQPVDPRDLFAGDYIILNYDISTINSEIISFPYDIVEGDTVYVSLEKQDDGTYIATGINHDKPNNLAIKGTVIMMKEYDGKKYKMINLEYGIESYFIPENSGRNFSRITKVKVVIDSYGNSKIKAVYNKDGEIDPSKVEQYNR